MSIKIEPVCPNMAWLQIMKAPIVASGRSMANVPPRNRKCNTYVAARLRPQKGHVFSHCGPTFVPGHKSKVRGWNQPQPTEFDLQLSAIHRYHVDISSGTRSRVSILAERELAFRKSPSQKPTHQLTRYDKLNVFHYLFWQCIES